MPTRWIRWAGLCCAPGLVLALVIAALLPARRAAGDTPLDDGVPSGAVMFFMVATCPDGWAPAADVAGRLQVGVTNSAWVGQKLGTPLGPEEDRAHEHLYYASATLPEKALAASDGDNQQGAAAKSYSWTQSTHPATTNLPFIELQTCVKQ